MTKRFRAFLRGMGDVLNLFPDQGGLDAPALRVTRRGVRWKRSIAEQLSADWAAVNGDINRVLARKRAQLSSPSTSTKPKK